MCDEWKSVMEGHLLSVDGSTAAQVSAFILPYSKEKFMGTLDEVLGKVGYGDTNVCKFSKDHYEVTYTVSPESHAIAYAIAIRESELDALAELLEAEREAPMLGDENGSVEDALANALDDESVDAEAVTERLQQPRRVTEAVLEAWREGLVADVDVGYVPIGVVTELAAFVSVCRERHDRPDDSFELPESAELVGALLVRCKRATERDENRVVVNVRHLPTLESS